MATIVEMINPLTGLPEQVDKLDHTAQEIDDAAALAPQLSNPNLLDNWYFPSPVNQRGQTSYTGEGYTIDRWETTGTVVINNGYITASGNFIQKLPNGSALFGRTITASIFKNDTLITGTVTLSDNYSEWEATTIFDGCVIQYRADNVFAIIFSGGNLKAVKLELGGQQTLAHQDANGNWVLNEIPDYGEQLRRCQRYFQVFATESLRPTDALDFRPVMRTNPALSAITVGGKTLYTASADL